MQAIARKWMSFTKASGLIKQMILEGSHQPEVLDTAAEIISDLAPMNYVGEAQAIWLFVRDNVRYVEDPSGDDHFQGPTVTMARHAGDCDDQVILLACLLRSIGFRTRIVFVFHDPPKNYSVDFPEHVYLECDVNKGGGPPNWVCVETIPLPDNFGGFSFAIFGVPYPRGYREFLMVD